ncbi:hypothetical protein R0K19_25975, partial [Bacillus sp. SIMBA_161]
SAFARQLDLINTNVYFQHQICFVGVENAQIVSAALLKHPHLPEPAILHYISPGRLKLLFPGSISAIQHLSHAIARNSIHHKG